MWHGFCLQLPRFKRPVAGFAVIPAALMEKFYTRKTHISQAETLAAALLYFNFPDLVRGRDIIH